MEMIRPLAMVIPIAMLTTFIIIIIIIDLIMNVHAHCLSRQRILDQSRMAFLVDSLVAPRAAGASFGLWPWTQSRRWRCSLQQIARPRLAGGPGAGRLGKEKKESTD